MAPKRVEYLLSVCLHPWLRQIMLNITCQRERSDSHPPGVHNCIQGPASNADPVAISKLLAAETPSGKQDVSHLQQTPCTLLQVGLCCLVLLLDCLVGILPKLQAYPHSSTCLVLARSAHTEGDKVLQIAAVKRLVECRSADLPVEQELSSQGGWGLMAIAGLLQTTLCKTSVRLSPVCWHA